MAMNWLKLALGANLPGSLRCCRHGFFSRGAPPHRPGGVVGRRAVKRIGFLFHRRR